MAEPARARGLFVLSHQQRLGAADGGLVEQYSEVTGNPKAARVRQAVAVYENQIGLCAQAGEGSQQHGTFTKGKQTRNIGKPQLAARHAALHFLELRKSVNDDAREGDVRLGVKRQICAGHKAEGREIVLQHDALAQPLLKAPRRARCKVPARV